MPRLLTSRWFLSMISVAVLAASAVYAWQRFAPPPPWSDSERSQIDSLWLANLPPLEPDASNAYADDPQAAEFGHQLFFSTRLSANGMVSCATCHQPERQFSDGLPLSIGIGRTKRNSPSVVGTAYSPWQYWDGRRDSQWSQALSPLMDINEHGMDANRIMRVVATEPTLRSAYESLFGPLPALDDLNGHAANMPFANIGKAIAAYERLLLHGDSRFDRYAEHLAAGGDYLDQDIFSEQEIRGLRLFIGDARCTECHNGPLFTNNEFHNTGLLAPPGELPERGRVDGLRELLSEPYNCLGEYSDNNDCLELRYVRTGIELIGATRTPSLRNLENTAPYQSKAQFQTLAEVLQHYNEAPLAMIGHNEAEPLNLADWQLDQLEAFLGTLASPVAADERWLAPPN